MLFSVKSFNEIVKTARKDYRSELGEDDYARFVLEARRWSGNLANLQKEDLNIISKFLNSWGQCRIPWKEAIIFARLREIDLTAFQSKNLIDLAKLKGRNGTLDFVGQTFESLALLKLGRRTFGPTGTSKLFHLILPTFFVMWDESIRDFWGCAGNAAGYCNFLLRMSFVCEQLVEGSYPMNEAVTRDLDIYNYMMAHHPKFCSKILDFVA